MQIIKMKRIIMILSCTCLLCLTQRVQAQFYAVRFNTLALATGTISGGMDVAVSKKTSLDLTLYWNPLRFSSFQTTFLVGQAGVRFWRFEPNTGPSLGVHVAGGRYDIGGRRLHYKGFVVGLGVSYGYSWLLSKRWSLTAEIGAGLFYTDDTRRDYFTPWSDDELIRHNRRLMILPSKAEIGFSYLF